MYVTNAMTATNAKKVRNKRSWRSWCNGQRTITKPWWLKLIPSKRRRSCSRKLMPLHAWRSRRTSERQWPSATSSHVGILELICMQSWKCSAHLQKSVRNWEGNRHCTVVCSVQYEPRPKSNLTHFKRHRRHIVWEYSGNFCTALLMVVALLAKCSMNHCCELTG